LKMRHIALLSAIAGLALAGNANAIVAPTELGFDCITSNGLTNTGSNSSCTLGETQFSAIVHGDGASTDFTFYNTDSGTDENPSVHDIYFDSSLFDSGFATDDLATKVQITDWSWGDPLKWTVEETPRPKNLPSGSNVGFLADFGADANDGNQLFNEGNWLTINIDISYDLFLSALSNDDFDIGLHVGSLNANGDSESFTSSAVPVPAAFWLFGSALVGFIGMSRRTKVS